MAQLLPKPPNQRALDPLDPAKILEDAKRLPRFRNSENLRVGMESGTITPEQGRKIVDDINQIESGNGPDGPPVAVPNETAATATQPIASWDRRTPADRAREQNDFRRRFNGETPDMAAESRATLIAQTQDLQPPPRVRGPAQRAIMAANSRGAELPKPPQMGIEAAHEEVMGEPPPVLPTRGRTVNEMRQLARAAATEQNRKLAGYKAMLRGEPAPSDQPLPPDATIRQINEDDTPEVRLQKVQAIERGEGGGLFANLGRGFMAGTIGIAESVGTITRYLGGEMGLEGMAAQGLKAEKFWHARMMKYVERANLPQGNIIDNPELLMDGDWMTYQIGQIIPSLLATMTVAGVARMGIRKLALNQLAKQAGTKGAVGAGAGEAIIDKAMLANIASGAGRAGQVGKASKTAVASAPRYAKIGGRSIDMANPLVQAKLARIGKASFVGATAAGGVFGGALEGSATYRETYDTLIEQGAPPEVARETAENAFLMMTAASGVLNAVGLERFLRSAPGIKAKTLRGLQEALTEYLEGPAEAAINLGQGTISVEEAIQKIKDEANVAPAAFITSFFLPGSGAAFGTPNDKVMGAAEEAAANLNPDQDGEPLATEPAPVGPAGGAANQTDEEATGVAQAEAEGVDETTVQEPDVEPAAAKPNAKAKPKPKAKPKAKEPAAPKGVAEGGGVVDLPNTKVDTRLTLGDKEKREVPAVGEDGRIKLTHYSRQEGLTELDPSYNGKGLKGQELKRKAQNPDSWVDRTYFGLSVGEEGGYQAEPGLKGGNEYTTSVDPSKLYDYKSDPLELFDVERQGEPDAVNRYEKAIKEAGFAGYWTNSGGKRGLTAALFESTAVEPNTQEQANATLSTAEGSAAAQGAKSESSSGKGGSKVQSKPGSAGGEKESNRKGGQKGTAKTKAAADAAAAPADGQAKGKTDAAAEKQTEKAAPAVKAKPKKLTPKQKAKAKEDKATERAAEKASKTGKPVLRKSREFATNGEWKVTLPSGEQKRIFYDQQSQTWYDKEEWDAGQGQTGGAAQYAGMIGFTKQEAIDKLQAQDSSAAELKAMGDKRAATTGALNEILDAAPTMAERFSDPNDIITEESAAEATGVEMSEALKSAGLPSSGTKQVKLQRIIENQADASKMAPEELTRSNADRTRNVVTNKYKTDEEYSDANAKGAMQVDAEVLGVTLRANATKAEIAKAVRAAAAQEAVPVASAPEVDAAGAVVAKAVKAEETIPSGEAGEAVKQAHAKSQISAQEGFDFTSETGVPAPATNEEIDEVIDDYGFDYEEDYEAEYNPEYEENVDDDGVVGETPMFAQEKVPGKGKKKAKKKATKKVRGDQDKGEASGVLKNKDGSRRTNANGDFAGARRGINTEEQVTAEAGKIAQMATVANAVARLGAESGTFLKSSSLFWYERSAQAIREVARGNKKRMDQLARLFALYSQGNTVTSNTTAAIRSLNEYLDGNTAPLAGRFPEATAPMVEPLLKAKSVTKDIAGVENKIMSFYRNLYDPLFGTDTFAEESTIDLWMMRLMGYRTDQPSASQYAFARELMIEATRQFNETHGMNIKPRQLQAAVWTKIKNDTAQMKQRKRDRAIAFGRNESVAAIAASRTQKQLAVLVNRLDGEQALPALLKKGKTELAKEYKRLAKSRKPSDGNFEPESIDFGTTLDHRTQKVASESVPSTSTANGAIITARATLAELKVFHNKAMGVITGSRGKDLLADIIGINLGNLTNKAMGGYTTNMGITQNPVRLGGVLASQAPSVKNGQPNPDYTGRPTRTLADVYSWAMQYMYRQDAVPWYRPSPGVKTGKDPTGVSIRYDNELSAEQELAFHRLLHTISPELGFTRVAPGEYDIVNFRGKGKDGTQPWAMSDAAFKKAIDEKAGEFEEIAPEGELEMELFRAEAEFHNGGPNEENWTTDPEGKWIETQIREAGFAHILPWLNRRRGEIDAISDELAERLADRKLPRVAKQQAERSQPGSAGFAVPLDRLNDTWGLAVTEILGRFGSFSGRNTTNDLKIYDLQPLVADIQRVLDQAAQHGFVVKLFSFTEDLANGIPFKIPNLKKEGYDKGIVWIYNPRNPEGSFKDEAYTTAWRVTHEVAHGITEKFMQKRYGDSQRVGRLGREGTVTRGKPPKQKQVPTRPLTLKEAQRAVEWEQVAFRVQRKLLAELGINITDFQFNRENRINLSDAMFRTLTGEFGEPGEYGFLPSGDPVNMQEVFGILRETEKLLATEQGRKATTGININSWKEVSDTQLDRAIDEAKSNGNINPSQQATFAPESSADAILTADDLKSGERAPAESTPAATESAAEGAAVQLTDPVQEEPLDAGDDRVIVYDGKSKPEKDGQPAGVDADKARFRILDAINKLRGVVKITVVQSVEDLPPQWAKYYKARAKKGWRSKGFFLPKSKEIYIIADNLNSVDHAQEIIMHEAFGHFAMRDLPNFADVITKVQGIIARGDDPVIDRLAKHVAAHYDVESGVAIEEVIAHLAESADSNSAVMKEIFSVMKDWVRAMGFDLKMTNEDVIALIRSSRRRAERRAMAAAGLGIDRTSAEYAAFLKSPNLEDLRKAKSEEQQAAALDRLAREFSVPLDSGTNAPMTEDLDKSWGKVMNNPKAERTISQRIKDRMQFFIDLTWDDATAGLIDAGRGIEKLELSAVGEILDASVSAYKAFSTTRNINSVMGAVMRHGIPTLVERTKEVVTAGGETIKMVGRNFQYREGAKAFNDIFLPLRTIGGDSQMRNWEKWAVAKRSRRLLDDDIRAGRTGTKSAREKLLDEKLVDDTLEWARNRQTNDGRTYEEVFEEVLANWDEVNQANIDLAIEVGVLNAEDADLWRRYDYVPFWREMNKLEGRASAGAGGTGLDVEGAGIFRQKGGTDREGNPLLLEGNVIESMFMNTAYLLERSYRNEAMARTVELATNVGSMVKAPKKAAPAATVTKTFLAEVLMNSGLIDAQTVADAEAIFNSWPKQDQNRWHTFWSRVKPSGPDIVSHMVDGKPQYYFVKDQLLLRSIQGMGADQMSMMLRALRGPKHWLTVGVTTDPAFMIANWMRDTLSSMIVSDAKIRHLSDPIKGLVEAFNDSPAMMHLAYAGRGGGGFYDSNPDQVRSLLKELGHPADQADSFLETVVSPKKLWKFWKRVGTASEFGNRVRVYNSRVEEWETRVDQLVGAGSTQAEAEQTALNEGLPSPSEAAFQAQDLLNFTRSGDWATTQFLIQTVPFLNARLQGLNKFYRGYRENPTAYTMKAGSLVMVSVLYALLSDDDERFKELDAWDRDTYYHFWIGDEHFRLPKPFEAGVLFSTVPERLALMIKGSEGGEEFAHSMIAAITQTFAFNPLPQAVKPVLELYNNHNYFTDAPVVPASLEGLSPERQYDYRTGSFAKEIGDAMPDFAPDWLQSPVRLEHTAKAYFGALGGYIMAVGNVMTDTILDGPERTLGEITATPFHDLPVVKRFVRGEVPNSTKYSRELWEMMKEADTLARTIKKYQEEGQFERALGLRRDNVGILNARKRLRKITTQVSAVNKQINMLALNKNISPEARNRRIEALTKQKNSLAKQVEPLIELF